MAGKKKDPKVTALEETVKHLRGEIDKRDLLCKEAMDTANRAEERYTDLRKETREETRPLYVIAECLRGGKRLGIQRQAYTHNAHELLGLLEIAVEDVKLQIRGQMSQPLRWVMETTNTEAAKPRS